jgi:carboxylesterase type B
MRTSVALLALIITSALSFAQSDPIVAVTGGQLRGRLLGNGGAMFKGIPYAQPPPGDLRWREPMPPKTWSGVRSATEFGAFCAQNPGPLVPNAAEVSSEDCLV